MIRVDSERDQVNVAKVCEAGQEQIFEYWDEIGPDERRRLLDQIDTIDFPEFSRLVRTRLNQDEDPGVPLGSLEPAEMIPIPSTDDERRYCGRAIELGKAALETGSVGVLLVAGGPSFEYHFLRAAVISANGDKVPCWLQNATPGLRSPGNVRYEALP
ncbi:MAG: hypothetical protein KDC38_19020, partial [Planctomycetes bacterium]|nr:hypothetical protein [Planctomycetota bacterium]